MTAFDNSAAAMPLETAPSLNQEAKKIVLITGASRGLGLALTQRLLDDDRYFLILTARASSLPRFENQLIFETKDTLIRQLDVTDHLEVLALMSEINSRFGGVDILINNAGLIDRSAVEESSTERRIRLLEVNYLAPFDLISLVLSSMRKKNTGRIINISSAGGFMAMPTMAAYNASKFALEGASEALWYEVKPWGIHVTLVIPGFINSMGFLHTTESPRCKQSIGDKNSTYHEHYINMKNMIFNKMTRSHSSNEFIARKIVKLMAKKNPPLRAYATLDARFFNLLKRICPQKLYHIIMYWLLPNVGSWGKQKHRKR